MSPKLFVREKSWDGEKDCEGAHVDNDTLICLRSMLLLYLKQMAFSRQCSCLDSKDEAGASKTAAGRNGLKGPALHS